MTDYSQDLKSVAIQAKAPVLAEVTESSGQGALTPVQSPSNLAPIQPKHLAVEDIQALESEAESFLEKVKNQKILKCKIREMLKLN